MEKRYANARKDVVSAFRYYMENDNQGRPFILAGHSQGAKAIVELIKHTLTAEQLDRMVAAYAFGFSISTDKLKKYVSSG